MTCSSSTRASPSSVRVLSTLACSSDTIASLVLLSCARSARSWERGVVRVGGWALVEGQPGWGEGEEEQGG